jgi:hypothetical protein
MSIGESKQHNQILIQPIPGGEDSLRDVFWMDLDLMVTQTEIDLQKRMLMRGNGYLFLMVTAFKGQ